MLISVIVPVYNICEYISDCIESILSQTSTNWECILVDDGSTDGSEKICDKYASEYDNVFVIHKINGGLAAARNSGVAAARGDYLYFLDGDDLLIPSALELLQNSMLGLDVDLVIGHMSSFYDSSEPIPFNYIVKDSWVRGISGKKAFENIINKQGNIMMGVRGLYNKSFLLENNLLFDPYYRYSEDQEWTPRVFEKANRVVSCETPVYLYRTGRPGSLMNSINLKKIELTLEVYDKWHDVIIKNEGDPFFESLYKILIDRYWEFFFKYPPTIEKKDLPRFYKMMDSRKKYLIEKPKKVESSRQMLVMRFFRAKTICKIAKVWLRVHQ